MPENGQAESKPEPKPEPKPEDKPATRGKSRYVNYQELSKDELVAMLKRVNRRLSEANKLINEALGVLYYGNTQAPQEGGGQGNQYRKYRKNYGYRSYGNRQYGYKRNYRQKRSESEDEDVNYD